MIILYIPQFFSGIDKLVSDHHRMLGHWPWSTAVCRLRTGTNSRVGGNNITQHIQSAATHINDNKHRNTSKRHCHTSIDVPSVRRTNLTVCCSEYVLNWEDSLGLLKAAVAWLSSCHKLHTLLEIWSQVGLRSGRLLQSSQLTKDCTCAAIVWLLFRVLKSASSSH